MGYKNDNKLQFGSMMLAPVFENVGTDGVVDLTTLEVSGYDPYNPDEYEGGCDAGALILKLRDEYGAILKKAGVDQKWMWVDNGDTREEDGGPGKGWYVNYVSEDTKIKPGEVTFDVGDGLWIDAPADWDVKVAGGVVQKDVTVPLRFGSTASGNPFPVEVNIDSLTVTGYPAYNPEEYEGGVDAGQLILKFLDPYGAILKVEEVSQTWMYVDNGDTREEDGGPGKGWYKDYVSEDTKVTGNALKFFAGKGVWVDAPAAYNLVWKAPKFN